MSHVSTSTRIFAPSLAIFLSSACGGAQHATATGECEHAEQREQHHAESAHEQSPIAAFHSVIAPIWHSTPGADRAALACAHLDPLDARASDVAGSNAANAASLTQSLVVLRASCQGTDVAATEAALTEVHTAFHQVMEAAQ